MRTQAVTDLEHAKQMLAIFENENNRLHARIRELIAENAKLSGKVEPEQLALELSSLEEQLSAMQRRLFGDSSERQRISNEPQEQKEPKTKTGHGRRAQPRLDHETLELRFSKEELPCEGCGQDRVPMSGSFEVSQDITVVFRKFVVRTLKRQRYTCGCETNVAAPLPVRHLEGGRYSLDFAVEVAVDKYLDHLPLERQVRRMERDGLVIDSQTLWDQLDALALHCTATCNAIGAWILKQPVIGGDETWWRLMNKSTTKRWWVWTICTPQAVFHTIRKSRSAQSAMEVLGDYQGTLVCDGYAAYATVRQSGKRLKLAHCWSHARRKFFEAAQHYPQCEVPLRLIGEMFHDDPELRFCPAAQSDGSHVCDKTCAVRRRAKQEPRLEALKKWAYEQQALPNSAMRKAIAYLLKHWEGLTVFLDDVRVPLDNNHSERELRSVVVGRKNHYGSRSQRGTEVAAIFYTLTECARLNGIDAREYIREVATRWITRRETYLPFAT